MSKFKVGDKVVYSGDGKIEWDERGVVVKCLPNEEFMIRFDSDPEYPNFVTGDQLSPMPPSPLVLTDEQSCLGLLAQAWNKFLDLEELHPAHKNEFMMAIHAAQNIILARPHYRDSEWE